MACRAVARDRPAYARSRLRRGSLRTLRERRLVGRSGQNWALESYHSCPENWLQIQRLAATPALAEAERSVKHCRTASTAERARRSRRPDQSVRKRTSGRFKEESSRLTSGLTEVGPGAKLTNRSNGTPRYRERLTSLSIGMRFLPSSYFWTCWKLTSRWAATSSCVLSANSRRVRIAPPRLA